MNWYMTTQFDERFSRELVDTHYSRKILWPQSIGKRQFAIAKALVLVTEDYSAGWISRWQNPEARNDGKDAWVNQLFNYRVKKPGLLASELINEAIAITRWYWQDQGIPKDGFITYIADRCVTSEIPGYCYMRATPRWKRVGMTKSRKLQTLVLTPEQLKKVTPLPTIKLKELIELRQPPTLKQMALF